MAIAATNIDVAVGGVRKYIEKGAPLPAGVTNRDLARLQEMGAIEEHSVVADTAPAADTSPSQDGVADAGKKAAAKR